MFATFLSQVIADGESSLTTADDNRIDFVQHGRLLDSEAQHEWSKPIPGSLLPGPRPGLESTRLARSKSVQAMPVHDDRAVHERHHLSEVLTVVVGDHVGVGEDEGNVRHRPVLVLADLKDSGGELVVL